MSQKELFKPIPGFEGNYEVSNTGKVLSLKRANPTVMKNTVNEFGMRSVNLRTGDNKTVKEYVAKLVFEVFGELPTDYDRKKYVVTVKDGDYDNLGISNLELTTKAELTKSRFKGKSIVTKDSVNDLPDDAIILEPKMYQLNAIEKKEKKEIAPKVSLSRDKEIYRKYGNVYEQIESVGQLYLLLEGIYNMDRIAQILDRNFPKSKFEMIKYEEIYTKKEVGKRTVYKQLPTDCAFVLKQNQQAAPMTVKDTILDNMEPDYDVTTTSRLWMEFEGRWHKVLINKYEESPLSPVNYRGSLALRLRREELKDYMEDYIFSKKGSKPQEWYTIPCATILMEEKFNKHRPSAKHVLGTEDFNFLNLREDNLIWETASEREDRIKTLFPGFEVLRKRASSNAHYVGLPSERIERMVEKYYWLEGKSMAHIAKMISSKKDDEDFFPRVRYYINSIKEGRKTPHLEEVKNLL